MGIETPVEYSGSGCGFLTMMLVVEELSRVDPAVAAYVDIHNTLVNSLFMKLGTEEQKQKYLTKLCTEYVSYISFYWQNVISRYKTGWLPIIELTFASNFHLIPTKPYMSESIRF